MLKHTATEVIEATEAFDDWRLDFRFNDPGLVEHNKQCFADELADIICCCTIIAGRENIDLDKAVADRLERNRLRAEGKRDRKCRR